jgi:hypothetical protein
MTDTPPQIQRMLRAKMMARSGEERFVMGAQMFDSAVEMIKASLPAAWSEADRRRELFKRLYGKELDLE